MTTDTIVSPDWWSTQSGRHDYSGTPDWCECGEFHESVFCFKCEDSECPAERPRNIRYRERAERWLCSECLGGHNESGESWARIDRD